MSAAAGLPWALEAGPFGGSQRVHLGRTHAGVSVSFWGAGSAKVWRAEFGLDLADCSSSARRSRVTSDSPRAPASRPATGRPAPYARARRAHAERRRCSVRARNGAGDHGW